MISKFFKMIFKKLEILRNKLKKVRNIFKIISKKLEILQNDLKKS